MSNNWFDVNKSGLKKIQSEKDKFFIVSELVSNSFDEDINVCEVHVWKSQTSSGKYFIQVKDDSPDGFRNLSHSYTMFAESYKKDNVKQRGRFNIGEKFALSMFDNARIQSTRGTVIFNGDGRKKVSTKTKKGTIFTGEIKMKHEDYVSILEQSKKMICPVDVEYKVNNEIISRRKSISSFVCTLPTIIADIRGNLNKSYKQTVVSVYPKSSEKGKIFELGIPVVDIDIDYDVDIEQKIPLNKDRDNVTPAFRKQLCTEVLNHCFKDLSKEQVKTGWVMTALENAKPEAVQDVLTKKHGEDAVVYDLKDTEANKKAFADSREIIHGGSYNSKVWENIRTVSKNTDLFKSAGQYPQYAKPKFGGGAKPVERTEKINEVVDYAKDMFFKLFTAELNVSVHDGSGASATFCRATNGLSLFYNVLGKKWFDLENNKEKILSLLIHEFAHYIESDHLSKNFHDACCDIGAKWFMLNEKDSRLC